MMQAPPKPCSARAEASSGSVREAAHSTEANTNKASPNRQIRACPSRSPSAASGNSEITLAS